MFNKFYITLLLINKLLSNRFNDNEKTNLNISNLNYILF